MFNHKLTATELLNEVIADGATFLFGSGISTPEPTNIPTVDKFYSCLMKTAGTSSEYSAEIWHKNNTITPHPRFEVFTNEFQKLFDDKNVYSQIYNKQSYNSIHYVLALLIENGATGITTNFDECIENAGLDKDLVISYTGKDLEKVYDSYGLYKAHGSISNKNGNLVITDTELYKTSYGFKHLPNWKQTLLNSINNKNLIVFGYSGTDDFDITPIIALSNPKIILWINHDSCPIDYASSHLLNEKIRDIIKKKNFKVLNGSIQSYIHDNFDTKYHKVVEEGFESILNKILDTNDKKILTQMLLLKHFNCYHKLLEIAKNYKDHQSTKYYIYSLFKLGYCDECIEYIKKNNLLNIYTGEERLFVDYYLTSSMLQSGKYKQVIQNLDNNNTIFSTNDFRSQCDWNNLYGASYFLDRQFDLALNYYKAAKKCSEYCGYLNGLATALWGMADIYAMYHKYQQSLSSYLRSLDIMDSLGKNQEYITISRNVAEVYIDMGMYPNARRYLQLAKRQITLVDQKYNNFYIYFTEIKLYLIFDNEIRFYQKCNEVLNLVNSGIVAPLLAEFLIILIVAYIDREYSLEELHYNKFLELTIKNIDSDYIEQIIGVQNIRFIYDPKSLRSVNKEKLSEIRSLVFHSSAYLEKTPL